MKGFAEGFAETMYHECVSAFFAVKELVIPAVIIAVLIREAVCE